MKDEEQKQRHDKWREIVEAYLQSSMTQKALCEQHNLSLPKLVYYHGLFKREKASSSDAVSFVPVKIPSRKSDIFGCSKNSS